MYCYEIISPFQAETYEKIEEEFKTKKIVVDETISEDIKDLIYQMLEYSPDKRIELEKIHKHPAILSRLKNIEREITQEEFKLLRKYYYMNSGGNQLSTHNSMYARQLKRESMLIRDSILKEIEQKPENIFLDPNLRNFKKKSTFDQRRDIRESVGGQTMRISANNFEPDSWFDDVDYENVDKLKLSEKDLKDIDFFKNENKNNDLENLNNIEQNIRYTNTEKISPNYIINDYNQNENIIIESFPMKDRFDPSSNLDKDLYMQANRITTTITRTKLYDDASKEDISKSKKSEDAKQVYSYMEIPELTINNSINVNNYNTYDSTNRSNYMNTNEKSISRKVSISKEKSSKNSNKSKNTEPKRESSLNINENKKVQRKYKVTTVPLERGRVKVNHEKKLSNIEPITVIQHGTFAFLGTYDRNNVSKITKRERSRSQRISNEEELKNSSNKNRQRIKSELILNDEKIDNDTKYDIERSKTERVKQKYTLEEYLKQIKLNN